MAQSITEKFLLEEQKKTTISKSSTRLELARAENKKERAHNNLRKSKQRAKKAREK